MKMFNIKLIDGNIQVPKVIAANREAAIAKAKLLVPDRTIQKVIANQIMPSITA